MPRTANAGSCSTKGKGTHTKKRMEDVHGDVLEKARKQGLGDKAARGAGEAGMGNLNKRLAVFLPS